MENEWEIAMDQKFDQKKYEGKNIGISTNNMMNELKERVKELDCFYRITKIVKSSKLSADEALQQIVEQVPYAWQYPNATCAQITIRDGKKFKTSNFEETKWALVR